MESMEKVDPIPQGRYVPATRFGNLIYTAGMTPRKNGVLILSGKVKADEPLGTYKDAVYQATSNTLIAARNKLQEGESIRQILQLIVYVNAGAGFGLHSRLADWASEYLYAELSEVGIAARAALGIASLPDNAPIEIQMVCAVG